jgi:Tfp pilus assembly protein PilF
VAVAFLVASVGRHYAGDWYRRGASDALAAGQATLAVQQADRALSLNPESLESHYVRAGALARLGDQDGAMVSLRNAVKKEPDNYLPWALLGDLAVRRGELSVAARRYSVASRLNPLDPTLRSLASDPRTADD